MAPNKKRSFNRKPHRKKSTFTKYMWIAIALIAIIAIVSVAVVIYVQSPKAPTELTGPNVVVLQTSMGNITIILRTDKPITSGNFRNLVVKGLYDGTIFNRVISNELVQGGEINSTKIPTIKDEIGNNNRNIAFSVAMANAGKSNSATSQFFINIADHSTDDLGAQFNAFYTVFGNVADGFDVITAMSNVPCNLNPDDPTGVPSIPQTPIYIIHASMLPDPN
jgi:cyclophilin family peptidyl-prolyl cis-trans isomerase